MPLLWALSSTLSISVYNVIRGKSLQLREAWRQATAWGRQEPRVYWSDLERPAGVSFLILTVVEDKLTSWWSHCVWCHKIRVTHWQEFHHQSCSLTIVDLGQLWVFLLSEYWREPASSFCKVVTMTYYCSKILVTFFQLSVLLSMHMSFCTLLAALPPSNAPEHTAQMSGVLLSL